ncbi:pyridoxamine 5'-phosphate oxidase family protein [Streptomyces sp. NPDC101209]|uniref:pyridoxamine 5'-phosphate oxidase family protein n=1 Tax=Streptomyces sp. NPDC101209 TaxID=3366129 RepID=UPI00382CB197
MKSEPVASTTRMIELSREECLALLASVPVGRVCFTLKALPAIRPANHLLDGETVVIRTGTGSGLVRRGEGQDILVYEADELDPSTRTGWSVMVTGRAGLVTSPQEAVRYRDLLIPWAGEDLDEIIRLQTDLVTGYRLTR